MIQEKIYCEMNWRKKKHIERNHARFIKTIALDDAIPRKSSPKCKKKKE